jgi:hypothetical protein
LLVVRLESEVGGILVPAGDVRRAGLFDEPGGGEDQDVGAYHVLDGVEDCRCLECLEIGAVALRLPLGCGSIHYRCYVFQTVESRDL